MAPRNPLLDLRQLRACQQSLEFGLADQHDLQQLTIGIQVEQQADFLEDFRAKKLRLVEHQNRLSLQRDQRVEELAEDAL